MRQKQRKLGTLECLTVWRKNPVASGSSGGWEQKIPPLVETNSVRAYAGKTSQFTAIHRSSCRDFRTHRISLKLGISSKVKQILILPIFRHWAPEWEAHFRTPSASRK